MSYALLGLLALITFWNRAAFFTVKLRYQPGSEVRRFLSYSSYAVLTAIWAPILFQFDYEKTQMAGQLSIAGVDYLIAATVAAALTLMRVKSIIVVLLSTALFFVLRFLVLQ